MTHKETAAGCDYASNRDGTVKEKSIKLPICVTHQRPMFVCEREVLEVDLANTRAELQALNELVAGRIATMELETKKMHAVVVQTNLEHEATHLMHAETARGLKDLKAKLEETKTRMENTLVKQEETDVLLRSLSAVKRRGKRKEDNT